MHKSIAYLNGLLLPAALAFALATGCAGAERGSTDGGGGAGGKKDSGGSGGGGGAGGAGASVDAEPAEGGADVGTETGGTVEAGVDAPPDGPVGDACTSGTECTSGFCVGGVCCNTECIDACKGCGVVGLVGTCSFLPKGAQDPLVCTGSQACDGAGSCKKADGQTCASVAECVNGFCADGVCCESACTETCKSCGVSGSLGKCVSVAKGASDPAATTPCASPNACDGAGACLNGDGQTCTAGTECVSGFCVDGVCCEGACTDTCKSCGVPGSLGTCGFVAKETPDPDATSPCVGANACNGAGACKPTNGHTCGAPGDCASGFCVDGYCCDTACTETCKTCDLLGAFGVCTNVPNGTADPLTCTGTGKCDGAGHCQTAEGTVCSGDLDCYSGFCTDGVCCESRCGETCKTCNGTGTAGQCTNVPVGGVDSTCVSPSSCGGTGVCRHSNGTACTGAADCLSGFCVDGVCCNTACTAVCMACNLAGKGGTCSQLASGSQDPPACTGTAFCDGVAGCKLPAGSACTTTGECQSGLVCCGKAGEQKTCRSSAYGSADCLCDTTPEVCQGDYPICCGAPGQAKTCRYHTAGCDCAANPSMCAADGDNPRCCGLAGQPKTCRYHAVNCDCTGQPATCTGEYGYCCPSGTKTNTCQWDQDHCS